MIGSSQRQRPPNDWSLTPNPESAVPSIMGDIDVTI